MSLEDLGDDIIDLMNEGYSFMSFSTKYFNFDRKLKIAMDDIYDVYLFKRKYDNYIIFEIYGGYLMMKIINDDGISSINMVKFDYENQIGDAERYIC